MILTFAMLASLVTVPALAAGETGSFADVAEGHWSETSVERWSAAGVLNGDGAGNFMPEKEMARAEFAQMLVNLMGYTAKSGKTFKDVPADAWYADAISKLAAAGVMQGDENGNAMPLAVIPREQAAVLLCRALNLKPTKNATLTAGDAHEVSDWAKDAVTALNERGMMKGGGDGNLNPGANINRASVAVLV